MQPPSADWGLQISESYGFIGAGYWWTALFPAIAIASLVVERLPRRRRGAGGDGAVTEHGTAVEVRGLSVAYRRRRAKTGAPSTG